MDFLKNIVQATAAFTHATATAVTVPFNSAVTAVGGVFMGNKTSSFEVGQHVMTVYGRGYIEGKRGSDYVVKLFHWKLAQGQSPTCYLNAEAIKPLFSVGQAVKTIYGRGYIESIRPASGDYVVKLDHWKLAQKQSPTLYLAHDSIQPLFSVFEKVKTVYGHGFVQAVREKDYVVKLNVWKLADGKSPTLYLAGESIQDAH